MNYILRIFTASAALAVASFATASKAEAHLELDLTINADQPSKRPSSVAGTLIIKNTGDEPVTVEHPHSRMAVMFILLNSLGNVVPPEGIAKVDPPFLQEITIQPYSEYKHSFDRLEFLTGSALFGYTLTPNEKYHLIAVYRPGGQKGTGITSPERALTVK